MRGTKYVHTYGMACCPSMPKDLPITDGPIPPSPVLSSLSRSRGGFFGQEIVPKLAISYLHIEENICCCLRKPCQP